MKKITVLIASALATAGAAGAVYAQSPGYYVPQGTYWQGAPNGLSDRIVWLQNRINRGVQDGSLDPQEARRSQEQLNDIRRQADSLQYKLDQLNRALRWRRNNNSYGYNGARDPYAIDYDAARYYRSDSRYQERVLGPNDPVYRGSDGRYYCRRSDGTVGLVIGGVGGAAVGNIIDGGHNRLAGTLIGGALGALLGQTVDRNSDVRCR